MVRSSPWLLVLALSGCEQSSDTFIPSFPDGGLVRGGAPLTRAQLMQFEGLFELTRGQKLLGPDLSVRTSPGTVSLLTSENAGFAVLDAACLPDRRVVLEGYWQYPIVGDAGLIRLFVDPPELAQALCDGAAPAPTTALSLSGSYGESDEFPATPLALTWARELKPWRGRFFATAHHGACEITDFCGVTPNTLESVRLAERAGSNAAEIDVRLTSDGIPIFFHDPGLSSSLTRGLFCNGQIADLSLAELRGNCQLKYGEAIPTMQEMLDMIVNETELEGVYLDIKVPEAVLPTSRIVSRVLSDLRTRNENADPADDRRVAIVVAIPKDTVLAAWHSAIPTLEAEGLAIPPCLLEYDSDLVISEGCVAWGPTWTEGPQVDNVNKVRVAGGATVFWTINQSDFIDEFLTRAQPDGIITARTALLFHRYQKIGTPPPEREAPAP